MIKTFKKLALGAALLSASAASLAATPLPFTIDETFAGGGLVEATELAGLYNEAIQVTNAGLGLFDATVLLDFTDLINSGTGVRGAELGSEYGLYAIVNFSGQVTSGAPNFSTGNWAGDIQMWLDPNFDTPSNDGTSVVDINNIDFGGTDVEDLLLFDADIAFGQSNGTTQSASFSLRGELVEDPLVNPDPLTADGMAYFVEPDPFYTTVFSFGLLNDFFAAVDFTSTDLQFFNSSANVNFIRVSEPSVIGLLGLSLVLLTLRSRKAK